MDIVTILESIALFMTTFVDAFTIFVTGFQWIFTNAATLINSFFSLLAFVQAVIVFINSFFDMIPAWLLPFPLAVLAYWMIMFIIKLGGK